MVFFNKAGVRLDEQFLTTRAGKFEVSKILSVKMVEETYTSAAAYPFLALGIVLIIFQHPLCGLPFLAAAARLAICHDRKLRRVVLTVCTSSVTQNLELPDSQLFKDLEDAISAAKKYRPPKSFQGGSSHGADHR